MPVTVVLFLPGTDSALVFVTAPPMVELRLGVPRAAPVPMYTLEDLESSSRSPPFSFLGHVLKMPGLGETNPCRIDFGQGRYYFRLTANGFTPDVQLGRNYKVVILGGNASKLVCAQRGGVARLSLD